MTKQQLKEFWSSLKTGVANDVVNALVRRVPVDTGFLKNSINYRVIGDVIEIYMADYGKYVEFGTPPHIIKAKDAKALKFNKNGKAIYATKVNHPGTRAQPFIRPTLRNDLGGIILDNIERRLT